MSDKDSESARSLYEDLQEKWEETEGKIKIAPSRMGQPISPNKRT